MKKTIAIFFRKILLFEINLLSKMRLLPIRSNMGNDGVNESILRKFVNSFINDNINNIQGDILEIGRRVYEPLIPRVQVKSYTCLDIEKFPDIDIVADIQNMPNVESNKFDTIICTQVLEHVPSPFQAANELYRILKPGGKLIISVPFLNNYHMEPHDYWRFTEYSLKYILQNFSEIEVLNYGSTYHHVLATIGYNGSEVNLNIKERTKNTPKFPIMISAVAVK